jgi:hypothetical protein
MVSETVVTEVTEGLREYELVLIVSPQLADEAFDATIEKYSRFITGKGGIIGEAKIGVSHQALWRGQLRSA